MKIQIKGDKQIELDDKDPILNRIDIRYLSFQNNMVIHRIGKHGKATVLARLMLDPHGEQPECIVGYADGNRLNLKRNNIMLMARGVPDYDNTRLKRSKRTARRIYTVLAQANGVEALEQWMSATS